MNKHAAAIVFALSALAAAPLSAQTQVGVSIGINQPGVYGRIDIGNLPPPPVIYRQPVIYAPPPVTVVQQPVYLYVPPGHQKNWGKHCRKYGACGQPVYFVRESWIRERHARHRGHDDEHHGKGKKHRDHGHGHGHGKD